MRSDIGNIAQRATADTLNTSGGRQSEGQSGKRRAGFGLDKIALTVVLIYLFVPLGITLFFGVWTGKGVDFSTLQGTFSDPDLSKTLLPSLELAVATTILAIVLITPTAYWVQLRLPKARPLLDFLSLIPFAMPAIVLAVGLSQLYNNANNPLLNVLSLGL